MRNPAILLLAALALAPMHALAQAYPSKSVQVLIGSQAGSSPDLVARLVVQAMSEDLKQPFVVENRIGANGVIAVDAVARSAPDGHTVLVAPLGTVSINPYLYPKTARNPLTELAAVTKLVNSTFFLVVRSTLPVKNLNELIQMAKASPGKLNAAAPTQGSLPHLAIELLKQSAAVDVLNIPFKGSPAAALAVAAGDADFMLETLLTLGNHIQSGKVRALAVTIPTGAEAAAGLPTFAEAGVQGMDISGWIGMFAPAATPKEVILKLQGAASRALQRPEVRDRLNGLANAPEGNTPDQFSAQWKADSDRWAKVIKAAGIRLE
jgi:tripartite-type tricarboxylate transporter receptor subunit TctC